MNLVVHIPHQVAIDDSGALGLAQRAPAFILDRSGGQQICIATFPDLPKGIDLALQLVGEIVRVRGAWATVDTRPISNLTKLWQRLECYRESLQAHDPVRYCQEKSKFFHALVSCDARSCPVPCQFLCTPCMQVAPEGHDGARDLPLAEIAASGEIEWCPQLKQMRQETNHTPPVLLHLSKPSDRVRSR